MAWYRRRRWRPWRRRRRPWTLRRRRARRFVRRRPRRRYVSRWRRRRYRRRHRRGRRRRGRRRRKETIILRQWQPDVIKNCYITGFLPLIVCGTGNTQFNFVTHEDDIPPRGASYGGNLTNITFTLAGFYDQYLLHRNRWSKSNFDLDLVRYINTKLKLYRHDSVDYIVTYNRTGPFEVNALSYMHTHPLLMLMNKHHIVVPSMKTKPKGRRYIKVKIKPPKLMLNKWYFARDMCSLGLFQLYATGLELRNPWVREGTNSPIVGFWVLKPSIYNGAMTNLADTTNNDKRKTCFKTKLYPETNTPNNIWQLTYNKPMQTIYYQAASKPTNTEMKNKPYNWENYKTYYNKTHSQWETVAKDNYALVAKEYKEVYTITTTFPPDWDNRNYMSHDYGLYSPYFITPARLNDQWHSPVTYVRYNPMSDRGIGNRICIQWCSEASSDYQPNKNKCTLQDMPLYMLTYGYLDYVTKCTGSKSIWTDARVAIRCPYTDPPLTGSTTDTMFIPLSTSFMQGDMPWPTTNIPLKLWFKWYPMIMHQKACLETIVSCGPFMPRDQTASSWDITIAYRAFFKWGGNPLPPQPIDDPCQKDTHEIPDPDKHPRGIQISDPQVLGPPTVFHTWDVRRGLFSTTSLKRVSEYQPPDDPFPTGVVFKRPRLETQYKGAQENPEEDAYTLLKALQKEQETSSSEEELPQEEQEIQKTQLLKQLQLQQQQQRILKRGIRHLFGDVLRLRKGVHFNPDLL
nr:MAG: ORF1 [Torque teno virus]